MNDMHMFSHSTWNCKKSSGVCPRVSPQSILRGEMIRNRTNAKEIVQMERSKCSGGGSVSGSYTYVGRDTTKDQCGRIYEISESEKQSS